MVNREPINLDVYQDFDSIFPLEYFELFISNNAEGLWYLYYAPESSKEVEFGPLTDLQLLELIQGAPFLLEAIVFVYYLIESENEEVSELGVNLLRHLAQA